LQAPERWHLQQYPRKSSGTGVVMACCVMRYLAALYWQGDPFNCAKMFVKLSCKLLLHSWMDGSIMINDCSEIHGSCCHQARFHWLIVNKVQYWWSQLGCKGCEMLLSRLITQQIQWTQQDTTGGEGFCCNSSRTTFIVSSFNHVLSISPKSEPQTSDLPVGYQLDYCFLTASSDKVARHMDVQYISLECTQFECFQSPVCVSHLEHVYLFNWNFRRGRELMGGTTSCSGRRFRSNFTGGFTKWPIHWNDTATTTFKHHVGQHSGVSWQSIKDHDCRGPIFLMTGFYHVVAKCPTSSNDCSILLLLLFFIWGVHNGKE
jgi:hypothetical protein